MVRRIERVAIVPIIFFLLLGGGCGREEPSTLDRPSGARPEGTIVAMGDSLTEGLGVPEEAAYPRLLEEALQARGMAFRVVNAGVSGETSSGARARIDWVLSLEPDIIILETGANDGMRGIDPGLIRKNIQYMIQEFISRDIVVILLGMKIMPNLGPTYADAFAEIYTSAAAENSLVFMPFMLEGVAGVSHLNQPDGIHPTADGYRKVVKNMLPYVLTAIERQNQVN
jgi:acyl-CoA thioesterase-1